jgi:hypothetical protein
VKALALLVLFAGTAVAQQVHPPVPVIPPPECEGPCPPGYEPAYQAPVALVEPRERKGHFFARFGAGYAYRYAFGRNINGGALDITIGGRKGILGVGARFDLHAGQTDTGLTFNSLTVGPVFDVRATSRLHIVFGPAFGFLRLQRVTRADAIYSGSIGVYVEPTVDLLMQKDGGGLYVAARVQLDCMFGASTGLNPASVVVQPSFGYRF